VRGEILVTGRRRKWRERGEKRRKGSKRGNGERKM